MEDKEKQIFDEVQEKQAKLTKKLMIYIFGVVGILFCSASLILFLLKAYDLREAIIAFLSIGLAMILLGIILYFVIPTKYNYEKFKQRSKKYGFINIYEMNAKIIELEERIEILEKEKKS